MWATREKLNLHNFFLILVERKRNAPRYILGSFVNQNHIIVLRSLINSSVPKVKSFEMSRIYLHYYLILWYSVNWYEIWYKWLEITPLCWHRIFSIYFPLYVLYSTNIVERNGVPRVVQNIRGCEKAYMECTLNNDASIIIQFVSLPSFLVFIWHENEVVVTSSK